VITATTTTFACTPRRVDPTDDGYSKGDGGDYGHSFIVDVPRKHGYAITGRASCERLVSALGRRTL